MKLYSSSLFGAFVCVTVIPAESHWHAQSRNFLLLFLAHMPLWTPGKFRAGNDVKQCSSESLRHSTRQTVLRKDCQKVKVTGVGLKGRKWKTEGRKATVRWEKRLSGCLCCVYYITELAFSLCKELPYSPFVPRMFTHPHTGTHTPSVRLPCCCSSGLLPVVIYSAQQGCSDME